MQLHEDHTSQPPVIFGIVYEQRARHHRDTDTPSIRINILKSGIHSPIVRERFSTQGIIRPLEHSEHLPAFNQSPRYPSDRPRAIYGRKAGSRPEIRVDCQEYRKSADTQHRARKSGLLTARNVQRRCSLAVPVVGKRGGSRGRWMWTNVRRRASSRGGSTPRRQRGSHRLRIRNGCWIA